MRGYRLLLVFSLLFNLTALSMFVYGLASDRPTDNGIPGALMMAGIIGLFAGIVLRDLTERVEKLERARPR